MRTRIASIAAAVLLLLSTACTGTAPISRSISSVPPPPSSPTAGDLYTYSRSDVTAQLSYEPGGGSLRITNDGPTSLPAPGVYLLDAASGARVGGVVVGTRMIPPSSTRSFKVRFARRLAATDVGLIILLIGHQNYGAFEPPWA